MVELWNDGFKADEIQSTYSALNLIFYGAKVENGCLMSIIIKCRFDIFCRIDLFPLFIPSLPTFHYSIIPCGLPRELPSKAP